MNKSSLAVLLLAIGLAAPGVAQNDSLALGNDASDACAKHTACGHPQLVKPQSGAMPAGGLATATRSSRIEDNEASADPKVTWREDPSLMDWSWRRWPSLTDF